MDEKAQKVKKRLLVDAKAVAKRKAVKRAKRADRVEISYEK